jgi:hypothetical protein
MELGMTPYDESSPGTEFGSDDDLQAYEKSKEFSVDLVKDCKKLYGFLKIVAYGNELNQTLIYEYIHRILYQAGFIKEAADLITQIIEQNNRLMHRLSSDVKMIFPASAQYNSNIFQLKSPIKSKMSIIKIKTAIKKIKDHKSFADIAKESNPLWFFLSRIKNNLNPSRDQSALNFLRKICDSTKSEGNFNQEILFRIISHNRDVERSLFFDFYFEDGETFISTENDEKIKLSDLLTASTPPDETRQKQKFYLFTQLELWIQLSKNRNYNWKTYISKVFSKEYLL